MAKSSERDEEGAICKVSEEEGVLKFDALSTCKLSLGILKRMHLVMQAGVREVGEETFMRGCRKESRRGRPRIELPIWRRGM